MKRFLLFLALLIISLTVLLNVERLDVNGQNDLNLQSFVYVFIPTAILLTLFLPFFTKYRVYWTVGAWSLLYLGLKVLFNASFSFLSGIQMYLTMTELLFVIGIIAIAHKLAKEIQQFERSAKRLTLMMAGQRLQDIDAVSQDIHREITRSRQYQRPMSVILLEAPAKYDEESRDEIIEEIQRQTAVQYTRAKVAKSLQNELRLMDIVVLDHEHDQLVIVCPEVNEEGTKPIISKLTTKLNSMGFAPQFSSASFPEEGLTFAGLIETARQKPKNQQKEL